MKNVQVILFEAFKKLMFCLLFLDAEDKSYTYAQDLWIQFSRYVNAYLSDDPMQTDRIKLF